MARLPTPTGVIRFVWPRQVRCGTCGMVQVNKAVCVNGRRRTVRCRNLSCDATWVQVALHAEVDQGGGVTAIQSL